MIGAGHGVGAQQRTALDLEPDHGELAVLESEAGIAGGGEAEKRIGPVPDRKNSLSIECAHGFWFFRYVRCRMIEQFAWRGCEKALQLLKIRALRVSHCEI